MSESLETKTISVGRYTATINIVPDYDLSAPNEMDCEPEFFRADRGYELATRLREEFGDREHKNYQRLAAGEIIRTQAGDWYFGISEYRHSGSALSLCNSIRQRNWPDQQWDVIPMVGFFKVSKKLRQDWGIEGKRGVGEKVLANVKSALEMWEAYINGWGSGYEVKLKDESGSLVEEDSCYGFYFSEDAMELAEEMVSYYKQKYEQEKAE
jgi:hypothetical protein